MLDHAARQFLGTMAESGGQGGREPQAHRHRFAMKQFAAIAALGLEGMGEGVAEVEQGAAAFGTFLPLVIGDDGRFEPAAFDDRMGERGLVAGDDARALGLAPGPQRALQQPVLGDLGIARAQLPSRQRGEHAGVGQHDARLVEGAGQVLAGRKVDAGLAADGAVHLGEQRGRHLHEGQPAQRHRGRKAGKVANHPAAEGHHRAGPIHPGGQRPFEHRLQHPHRFGRLAWRDRDLGQDGDAGRAKALAQGGQVDGGHIRIGDDDAAPGGQHRGNQRTGAGEQVGAHQDVIPPLSECDRQAAFGHPFGERIGHAAGGLFRAFIGAIHDDVGLGVKRVAGGAEAFEHLGRIGVEEHRPVLTPGDAAQQHRQAAAQPQGDGTRGTHGSPRPRIGIGTTAGREHDWWAGEEARDHPAFAVAEMLLPVAGKDFCDRHASGGLDLGIGIAEGQAEAMREAPADRRFSRARHAHENHRPRLLRTQGSSGRFGQRNGVRQEFKGKVARHGSPS